jgi:iron complex outermembrane receptor protein/vitamin B12 transporter
MKALIELLHSKCCSCVIRNAEQERCYYQRGIKDLYTLYTTDLEFLCGASVADKVVGRAAAALMILGGVKQLYSDTISELALEILSTSQIEVTYAQVVPHIINRTKTGLCPLESLTKGIVSLDQILKAIEEFVASHN